MRIAVVDRDSCDPKKCGHECIKYCPVNKSGKVVWIDEGTGKAVISEKLCIGCGICVHKCPFSAITITNLPEELESDCVHRYFPGGFKLYRLPMLRKGGIVGVMGRNALGKTTVARILAGELVPNLCREGGADPAEVVRSFRGTELQTFFSELYGKRLRAVHKIQYIELIPMYLRGTVREVAERAKIPQALMERLGLSKLADRDISHLSGGELQKLAVAAALAKDADVYIFDEPATHLDIVERLKVASLMREKVEGRYAVVVEHDLTVLDYLADIAVVLYGKPGAYGIVSRPLGAREAVNEYLKGFLANENLRIREEPIKFESRPPERRASRQRALTQWTDLLVELGPFRLRIKEGYIGRGEVVGIIGPNGVGKTTFVRTLVGR